MLFRRLEIANFQCFHEVNRIDFPDPTKAAASLILVLGPNSGGKSTILRALKFLFYGDLLGHKEEEAFKLVNDRHRAEARGESTNGYVRATIVRGEETLTFQRTISLAKNGGEWRHTGIDLSSVKHDARRGDVLYEDEGPIQREIERVVPRSLFDYFYFKGEEITGTLLSGLSADVEAGIKTLLHLDDWDTAIEAVQRIQDRYRAQRATAGRLHQDYVLAEQRLTTCKDELKKREESLKKCDQQKRSLEGKIDLLTNELSGLSSGTPHESLTRQLDDAARRKRQAEERVARTNEEMGRQVGASAGLPFLRGAFDGARALLRRMHEENLLPADLSADFVDRLLDRKMCVCDRPLDPRHDKAACDAVRAYRERSLSTQMSSALVTLLKRLDAESRKSYDEEALATSDVLRQHLQLRTTLLLARSDAERDEKDAQLKLAQAKVDDVRRVAGIIRDCKDEAERCAKQKREDEIAIQMRQRERERAQKEVDKLRPRASTPELDRIARCIQVAERLQTLIVDSRDRLERSFRETMQSSVANFYDGNMTDGSKAFIDAGTLLPYVKTAKGESRSMSALGDGQKQLLALAHIFSLCQLRKTLHRQLMDLGIGVGHLDDQSFFLDSIFAPADNQYAGKTAQILPGQAHQIVLLLASQQWHDRVRPIIEPVVTCTYCLHLRTANQEVKVADYQMPFRDRMVQTLSVIKSGLPYSKIEEVK